MKSDSKHAEPTIHLVDDDPSILRALSRLLRSVGYHVEQFHSAEDFGILWSGGLAVILGVIAALSLSGNFLGEGRQFNMASYRANLDLDLVMDLDQTLAVQQGSIKEAVQV